ncbi:hypothetical protein [Polymorphospora sp. NPDC050346]|uniref:hypothetical protein n=1 Tax=Polymorphospora sp. NPDC050346 TaxID=3155780 RepID=UPI0033CA64DD
MVAGFAAAWARPAVPADGWWQEVSRWCEATFAELLRTVDPAAVPASRVTGDPVLQSGPTDGVAVLEVATDAGSLMVTVGVVDGRWLVTGNDFVRSVR